MNQRRLMIVAAAVCMVTASMAAPAQDKVTLKLNLAAGKQYHMAMTSDQDVIQSMRGMDTHVIQTIGMGMINHVERVDDDGLMHIKMTYDWVVFNQKGPGIQTSYDSRTDKDNVPLMAQGFAGLVGEGFQMQLRPDGSVAKFIGTDQILKAVMAKSTMPPGPMRDKIDQALQKQFNDQTLRENMEKMTRIFPGHPVGVGDTWSRRQEIRVGLQAAMNTTWTLKKLDHGRATIESNSTVQPLADAEPIDMGVMKMTMKLAGTQYGEMIIDITDGWMRQASVVQDLKGDMVMTSDQLPQPIQMPIQIKGNTKITGEVK
ncbi:hypothetical protein HED60_06795 [Planctomycetales bacterium ZRK34]|nr:hypothetical protein HED60_06795 [Planctomycetales bacterium ZRK34]